MAQQSWTTPQNAPDWITRTEKRLSALERREGSVSQILSIVGPAQNSKAMLIDNWNIDAAANNGYFWSRPGALHAPDGIRVWTGSVVSRTDNSGMQQVWNTDDLNDVLYYMRTFVDDGTGQGRTYSDWRNFATPTGFIELDNFGDTVDDLLADMAADIDNAAQALLFYEQDDEPVPGVSGVPAAEDIPIGSVWIDTNDNRHTYSWNGTDWISVESTLFAGIEAELEAHQDLIEAAAEAAADAMDFAVTLTMVYRQDSPPSNPDSNGRALVTDDVWFDSNDDNRMYQWDGDSWELLGIATEDYAADQATAAQAAAEAAAAIDASAKASAAQAAAIAAAAIQSAADAAAAQAAAIAVANTKNTIFRQNGIPTSLAIGDIWYDTDDGNKVYQAKSVGADQITTGEWEALLVGTSAIAPDSITSTLIAANTIVTGDLAATAIDGMTVTGATLQTVVTAARGIKINSTGLTAYNGSGTPTLTIVGATGAITMLGDLTSGSTITGAVVTGGTIQSEATAARGIKITSASMIAYNSSGVAQFTINASTGAVTLAGAMTGAGTITGPVFQTSASANTGIKISSSGMFGYNGTVAKFTLNATTGALNVDGPIITTAGISGSTITGGLIQTDAGTDQGIKINTSGMVFYAPSHDPVLTFDANNGNLIVTGAFSSLSISSAVITGGTVQTTATASRGVKITSAGLIGYNSSGVTKFTLDATTGVLTLDGGLLTSGSVTGAVVTGGTIQSEATAARGIKINSAGMIAYNSSGSARFTIDASTGDVVLAGNLTGAGLITGPKFRTAASGNRIEMSSSPQNKIEFYSGNTYETSPGFLIIDDKTPVSGQEDVFVQIRPPVLVFDPAGAPPPVTSNPPVFNMSSRVNTSTNAVDTNAGLYADAVEYAGSGVFYGATTQRLMSMTVFGTLDVSDLAGTGGGIGALKTRGYTVPPMTWGNSVQGTDGSGFSTFTFPTQLPSGMNYIVIASGGNSEQVYVLPTATAAGFVAQFFYPNGTIVASGAVRCYYLAFAY